MSNEQLQMIINLINSLGVQGKEAFIVYLLFHYLVAPITWIFTMFGIYKLVQFISGRFQDVQTLEQLRDILLPGERGWVTDGARRRMYDKINKLLGNQ